MSLRYIIARCSEYLTKGKIKALPFTEKDCLQFSQTKEKPTEIFAQLIAFMPLHETCYLKEYYGKFSWTFQEGIVRYGKRYFGGDERHDKEMKEKSLMKLEKDVKKIEEILGIKVNIKE